MSRRAARQPGDKYGCATSVHATTITDKSRNSQAHILTLPATWPKQARLQVRVRAGAGVELAGSL